MEMANLIGKKVQPPARQWPLAEGKARVAPNGVSAAATVTAIGVATVLPTVANNAPVFLYRSDRIEDLTVAIMTRLGIDPNSAPLGQQQEGAPVAPGAGQ